MAVWALLSISQTVKAADYFVRGAFENGDWPAVNSGLKMTPKGDNTYVLEYVSPQDGEYRFRFTGTNFEKEMCPYVTKTDLSTFSSTNPYGISTDCYEHPNKENGRYFIVNMKKGTTYVFTFKEEGSSRQVWCDVNTSTTPSPSDKNPIANRKYSKGYYLVGNFFNFDGDNINYKDAVFKFQQQNDDEKGNAVYMVEIPATLTAKAQVMSVGVTGTADAIYGPGSVLAINNSTLPVGADNPTATTGIKDLKSSTKIEDDGTNRWDMTTRRTESDGVGQDGSYKYYITVDKTTGKPSKWEIKYTDLKRVAYFISTDKSASALTIGSIRVNSTSNFGSGKYFGSLYIDKGGEYYAISNDLRANEVIDKGYSYGYGAIKNQIDRPTYNKLGIVAN